MANSELASVPTVPSAKSAPEQSSETPEQFCQNSGESNLDSSPAQVESFLRLVKSEAIRKMKDKETAYRGAQPNDELSPGFKGSLRKIRSALLTMNAKPTVPFGKTSEFYTQPDGTPFELNLPSNLRSSVRGFPNSNGPTPEEKKELEDRIRSGLRKDRPDYNRVRDQFLNRDFRTEDSVLQQRYRPLLESKILSVHADLKKQATQEYQEMISRNPFYAYVKSADPSPAEVHEARLKYAADLEVDRKKIENLDVKSTEGKYLSQFPGPALSALKQNPGMCGAFSSITKDIKKQIQSRNRILQGSELATLAGCGLVTVLTSGWGAPCFLVGGGVSATVATVSAVKANSELDVLQAGATAGQVPQTSVSRKISEQDGMAIKAVSSVAGGLVSAAPIVNTGTQKLMGQLSAMGGSKAATVRFPTSTGEVFEHRGPLLSLGSKYSDESTRMVKYLAEADRAPFVAEFAQGKLIQKSSNQAFGFRRDPRDLRPRTATVDKDVQAIFVIDRSGRMMVNPAARPPFFHHSSFAAGDDVLAAGEITMTASGVVKAINTGSGHYLPKPSNADEVLRYLRANGLRLKESGRQMDKNGILAISFQ